MSISPLARQDLNRVQVQLTLGRKKVTLGNAAMALQDARLSKAERAAIRSMVRAVQLLRQRAAQVGVDDAQNAVTLVLRDPEATTGGPWSSESVVAIGKTNALLGRTSTPARKGILFPTDVAIHELTHMIQFRGMNSGAKPNLALLEGVADSVAMLATGDSLLGEEYFSTGSKQASRGAIRNLDPSLGKRSTVEVVGPTYETLEQATAPNVDEHDAGGVISTIFLRLSKTQGRDTAEKILWGVIRDRSAWATGGSWDSFAASLRSVAKAYSPQVAQEIENLLTSAGFNLNSFNRSSGTVR